MPEPLPQQWPVPSTPQPIVVVGAGSIVRDAHLPVYRRLGFPVAGIFDLNIEAAKALAVRFGLDRVFTSLEEAAATDGVVFDLAVPPGAIQGIVSKLPPGAGVLIQKPLGNDFEDAKRIVAICRERGLRAASNFQLRFSPDMLALKAAIDRGDLGDVLDVEVRVVVHTPWEYWAFLKTAPRLEVLMHSIHYIDLVRRLLGDPAGVYCKGLRNPLTPEFADARTTMILDYPGVRCSILANHSHRFGPEKQRSQIKVEGTKGAMIATMGVNLDYPHGKPDELLFAPEGGPWEAIPLRGSWFLEAFEGPMSNLQRFVSGEDSALVSPVSDALRTMAVVEACYASSIAGGLPLPSEE
ncbi:MAG: Gfo/Idh/MocA family oxidoreductase [Dehalococcoidia bacterium]|nr:Gfo/Idh/MocA family oxidoreductase [Dehalococcoidia bacterium]